MLVNNRIFTYNFVDFQTLTHLLFRYIQIHSFDTYYTNTHQTNINKIKQTKLNRNQHDVLCERNNKPYGPANDKRCNNHQQYDSVATVAATETGGAHSAEEGNKFYVRPSVFLCVFV